MNDTKKKLSPIFITLILLASISIIAGFGVFFCVKPLEPYYNSDLIGALWSLSGAFIFGAALLYQVKEYKLQIIELRKSVDAQTETSKALNAQTQLMNEQKAIMLEQMNNELLLNSIEKFTLFQMRPEIQKSINEYYSTFHLNVTKKIDHEIWRSQKNGTFDIALLSKDLLTEIRESFDETHYYMIYIRNYIQYAVNIFDLINKDKSDIDRFYWFNSFFHNQFTNQEISLVYLSNLVSFGMPNTLSIRWNQPALKNFLEASQLIDVLKLRYSADLNTLLHFFIDNEYKNPKPLK
jgi:hypothetical protein